MIATRDSLAIILGFMIGVALTACRSNEGATRTESKPLPTGQEIVDRYREIEGCQTVRLSAKARVIENDGTEQVVTVTTDQKCVDGTQYSLRRAIASKNEPARGLLSIERPGQPVENISYLRGFDRFVEVSSLKHEDSLFGLSIQESLGGYDLYTYRVVGTERIGEDETYQVEGKLKPGAGSNFHRTVTYYRQDNGLPVRVELYNIKDQLLRIKNYTDWTQIDGHWTAMRTEIDNRQHKKRIVFETVKTDYNADLPLSFFSRENLKKLVGGTR